MAKVQFQVDGLDSNTASIFNDDVTFDGNVDANSISIAGNPISNVYATQIYVANAVSNVSVDLSTAAGSGIDWNANTSQYDIDFSLVQSTVANVSATEIGYLDGVTSSIQNQINEKTPLAYNISTKTSSYTAVSSDARSAIWMDSSSSNNFTLPTDSEPIPFGAPITIYQSGIGQTTIQGDSGVTVYSTGSGTNGATPKLRSRFSAATAVKYSSNVWYVSGDII